MLASHLPSRAGVSQSARSWVPKRARNARLTGESMSWTGRLRRGRRCAGARAAGWRARRGGRRGPCGPAGAAQADRGRAVRGQGRQPGAVGAQRAGEDERVEPVVFVPGRPVAAAQVLDLVRADHHHGDPRGEQSIDDRPVGTLDRDLRGTGTGQDTGQLAQPGSAVLDHAPADLAAAGIDDRYCVIVTSPVDPGGHAAGRFLGQGIPGRLQVCLLAASPSGEAPSCGAGTRLPVRSLIGARWRSALSTVGTSRVTARARRSHAGRQERQASRAMTWRHHGCISDPSKITDTRMVHQ